MTATSGRIVLGARKPGSGKCKLQLSAPTLIFTRRGKYQELVELNFYDEEAKQVNDQIELEISCANGMNEESLAAARALADSQMPADHQDNLLWYYIRMLCRQIIRVVDPK